MPSAPTTRPPGAPAPAADAPRAERVARRGPWALALAAYTLLVAAVVGWPTPVDANARAPLSALFAYLYGLGVPDWFDYGVLEKSANVAMFVPFGVLIVGLAGRRWWWAVLAPAAVSATAELAQHVLLPHRYATWTDVAANTAGAALGAAVALAVRARGRSARTASRRRP